MEKIIKFINLGKQTIKDANYFAFLWHAQTSPKEFLRFNGNQIWKTWDEFEADFWSEMSHREGEAVLFEARETRGYLSRFNKAYWLGLNK